MFLSGNINYFITMTNNGSQRLNRIEALLEQLTVRQEVTERIVQSNSRAIQAMIEQRESDRLKHEERIERLENLTERIGRVQEGVERLLSSIDEERPSMLRKLNTIENKLDRLLERD